MALIVLVACAIYILLSLTLMDACGSGKGRIAWVLLHALWWAAEAGSAIFTALALRGIGYYENLYFVCFQLFSAPTILVTGGLAITLLVRGKNNKITIRKINRIFFLVLVVFLAVQGIAGCIVGIWPTH